jgi:hypothetical protein
MAKHVDRYHEEHWFNNRGSHELTHRSPRTLLTVSTTGREASLPPMSIVHDFEVMTML